MHSRFAPVLLAVPIGIALGLDPNWMRWFGVRTPDSSFVTNHQAWICFGTAFAFGWLLHRQINLIKILEQRWLLNLVLSTVLIAVSFLLYGVSMLRPRPVNYEVIVLAGAVCYALAIWTTTFAVIGLALRFLSGLQSATPLSGRRVLLALSHSSADPDGAAGRGLPARLARAGQIRGDHAGRRSR